MMAATRLGRLGSGLAAQVVAGDFPLGINTGRDEPRIVFQRH
jgi:hypothetical protein